MYSNQTLNFDVLISKLNAHAHFQISKKKVGYPDIGMKEKPMNVHSLKWGCVSALMSIL